MKKKNLVRKAVLPALVALVCSVVALTSVSYAWFTTGTKAKVEGMSMEVTTADGLQISATGAEGTYKSNLTLNHEMKKVAPCSTNGTVTDDGALSFYKLVIDENGDKTDTAVASNAAQGSTNPNYYITFDIYVKVAAGKSIQLTKDSTVECEGYDTELATRVAFVNLGYADTAAKAMAGTLTKSNAVSIWEPNSTDRSQGYKNQYGTSNTGKLSYWGVAGANNDEKKTPIISSSAEDYVDTFDFSNEKEAETLFALGTGYNVIRVYIWLEGQDVDCVNEISGGTFAVKLDLQQIATPSN